MASIKIYVANALAASGVVLKNGTGGGAPALDEDSDWPMANLLSPDRYTYWRTSPVPFETHVDFDLGSAQSIVAAGMANLRQVDPTLAVPSAPLLYYGTGGSYPPSWTDVGLATDISTLNNKFETFGAISARFWRFELGFANACTCKLWLVKSADVIDLGHDWNIGSSESRRRLREVVTSPAGLSFAFEPGQARGSDILSGQFLLRRVQTTQRDSLRDRLSTLDTRFMVILGDGTAIETSLPEGNLPWSRRWSAPDLFDFELALQEHP